MLVCPSFEEDELVLLALGLMLHDHFLKVSLSFGYRIGYQDFYKKIVGVGRVES